MIYKQCENIIALILFVIFHPRMMFYDDQMHMSASLLSQVQFFSIDRNGQRQTSHSKCKLFTDSIKIHKPYIY